MQLILKAILFIVPLGQFKGPKVFWCWFCGPFAGPVSAMVDAAVNGAASDPIQQLTAYFDTVPQP